MAMRLSEEETRPVMIEAGLQPLVPYPGSGKPWLCRCRQCGEEVSPSFTNVKCGNSSGCAFCSGRRVAPSTAADVMRKQGLEPLFPSPEQERPGDAGALSAAER